MSYYFRLATSPQNLRYERLLFHELLLTRRHKRRGSDGNMDTARCTLQTVTADLDFRIKQCWRGKGCLLLLLRRFDVSLKQSNIFHDSPHNILASQRKQQPLFSVIGNFPTAHHTEASLYIELSVWNGLLSSWTTLNVDYWQHPLTKR